MFFISTLGQTEPKTISEAIRCGLAADGGLFVPETFPQFSLDDFQANLTYPLFAEKLLAPFFQDDPLEKRVASFCQEAFTFPLPLKTLRPNTHILELFHGPTLSFKDFGARFLAETLNFLSEDKKTTVMVATSGDTGSAVAAACYLKPNLQVLVLYPEGKISVRQEQQITCWGKNVLALAVKGTFDDCQQLVKRAFLDRSWQAPLHLNSANSINIGRLLPQLCYYAYTSMHFYRQHQKAPGFIIPTGNLGNATACYWAKAMGFPIREVVLATNANITIPDFLKTGEFSPRKSIMTLANAMDVGNPSNFERLRALYPSLEVFRQHVSAYSATDDDIRNTIQQMYKKYQYLVCPHTATACFAREQLEELPWIVVATANPCKFDDIIEPLLHVKVPIAPQLQTLLDRPTERITIGCRLEDIRMVLKTRGVL